MIIRPAEQKDIPALAALHKAGRRVSEEGVILASDLDREPLESFTGKWQGWLSDPDIYALAAFGDDGGLLGFSLFGRVKTRPAQDRGVAPKYGGEIYALYVQPESFRQGIGRALFVESCRALSARKINSVLLWALKKNKRACAFYEAMGGERIAKQRVDIGEKSWAEESCFAWRDVRPLTAEHA